ncbi:MAG: UbiX family flavin prenyltransferase [bacterium]
MQQGSKPVVLAITAASGIQFGLKTLEYLLKNNLKVELIFSEKAYYISKHEIGLELAHDKEFIKQQVLDFLKLEDKEPNLKVWLNDEVWASCASGSYGVNHMIIAPASMSSIALISNGIAENLICRAADVILKEQKNLVIVPRETPLSSIHLENMLKLSKMGVKIIPPIAGFYANIKTIDDYINFVAGKILDSCNIDNTLYERWSS